MALSRVKVWVAEELTSADLNAEFDNILSNATSLVSPLTANLTAGGYRITGLAAGSAGSPSLQPTGDTNTGLYFPAADQVGLVAGGSLQFYVTNTAAAGSPLIGMLVAPALIEAASGTHALLAGMRISAPTITPGAAEVTNAATVYIAAKTGATVTGADYALWIDAGDVRFDEDIWCAAVKLTLSNQIDASKLLITDQAAGDILYASSTTAWSRLAKGTDGQGLVLASGVPAWASAVPLGINNFRLTTSTTNLTLEPVNGNLIDINGTIQTGTAMPTLAAGLTASTLYYIYAYFDTPLIKLEASATGYTVDDHGRANKTGDATRRLVGIAYTDGAGAWSTNPLLVLSRDNRRNKTMSGVFTADRSTTSATYAELDTEIRVPFLTWGLEAISASLNAAALAGNGGTAPLSIAFDGTTAEDTFAWVGFLTHSGVSCSVTKVLAEGYHYATAVAHGNSGQVITCKGSATVGERTSLRVVGRG